MPGWNAKRALTLAQGHPCKEFSIHVVGGPSEQQSQFAYETWLWQLKGAATVTIGGKAEALSEGECCIVKPNTPYHVQREAGSLGMVVTQNPHGNKKGVGAREE
jgi:mannose-6-phosphate isomerase-like protein (cupin superfamily)